MASVIRCGQLMTSHLATIQRQSVQLKNSCRILNVIPIHGHDSYGIRRNYFNFQWDQRNHEEKFPFGFNGVAVISIGCASIAIYNV